MNMCAVEDLGAWTRARVYRTDFRPIPLTQYLVFERQIYAAEGKTPVGANALVRAKVLLCSRQNAFFAPSIGVLTAWMDIHASMYH